MDKTTQDEFSSSRKKNKKPSSISEAIHHRMDELNLETMSQLAAKVDLSLGSVSPVYHGKKLPTANSLRRYAEFLNIPLKKAKELATLPATLPDAAQTEAARNYELALAQVILTHGVSRIGLDANTRQRQKDPLQALTEARIAFEADIAAKSMKGVSPRLLLLLRRLPTAKHARLEQLITGLLQGHSVSLATHPNNKTTIKQSAKSQTVSAGHRNRRLSRSQRLTATVDLTADEQ